MKTIRARRGPFPDRPYYKLTEIERICAGALKSAGLLPDAPQAVRIDRFVEKYFKVSPRYEDLPSGVLGYTAFGREGVTAITLSRSLDEEGGLVSERRIRSTLAHEAGHGLLHTHLFAIGEKAKSLFDEDDDRPEILCRDVVGTLESSSNADRWWEFQANHAIGGLLMPRALVVTASERFCESTGMLGLPSLRDHERENAARELADVFDVNPIVARFRLKALFPQGGRAQMSL